MSNYRPDDYRPCIDPELNGLAIRAGMTAADLCVFMYLRTCIESRNSAHGLFRLSVSSVAYGIGMNIGDVFTCIERFGTLQINGQPVAIYDNDVIFMPTMAGERLFPENYKARSVQRSINKAMKDFQAVASQFADDQGRRCLVNRAFSAFQSANLELISEVLRENAAEAERKRNEKGGGNDRPPSSPRPVHPEDLPENHDRPKPNSGLNDGLFFSTDRHTQNLPKFASARICTDSARICTDSARYQADSARYQADSARFRAPSARLYTCAHCYLLFVYFFFRLEERKERVREKIFSQWRFAAFRWSAVLGYGKLSQQFGATT